MNEDYVEEKKFTIKKGTHLRCNCDYCKSLKEVFCKRMERMGRVRRSRSLNSVGDSTSQVNVTSMHVHHRSESIKPTARDLAPGPVSSIVVDCGRRAALASIQSQPASKSLDNGDECKCCLMDNFYYNLWRGELFKSNALEKENERLESKIKQLQNKLDKECLQQIKISLEWRKTVTTLVDENTRLKKLLYSSCSQF